LPNLFRQLFARRALIAAFAGRDIATRYRSSVLGWGWSLLRPLAQLLVYAAVFGLIFRVEPPKMGGGATPSFAAFLFTGMVTWNVFSMIVTLSMSQLQLSAPLLRKVYFPAWAPVLGGSVVHLIQVAIEFVVLVLFLLWLGNVGWTTLLAVPVLLATALFSQGLGLALAIINARLGDVFYIVTVLIGILYFLTPIVYSMDMARRHGGWLRWVVECNPMSWYVEANHQLMYSLQMPPWWQLVGLLLLGVVVFWAGLAYFSRTSEDIGEVL
jgi:ABC-type polysaccharide/polyol phosphate export permease